MSLTPPSSHGGGGGSPSAPYTPADNASDVAVLQDFEGDVLFSGGDGTGGSVLLSKDQTQFLVVSNAGITAGGSLIGFFGTTPVVQPQVPATPLPQDIVDALVSLGLVSQAS